MPIPLYEGILYGPVNSRRYGRSLGVNLLPSGRKVCSLDCNYCQLGFAKVVNEASPKTGLPSVEEVRAAVEKGFRLYAEEGLYIDDITVAGNGEPTLHPKFGEIVKFLREMRDKHLPKARLTLLSDGLHLDKAHVREGLALFDQPALKFEWGFPDTFAKMNGVDGKLFHKIVEGIRGLDFPYWIQALFVDGPVTNASPAEIEAWAGYLKSFHPKAVQIYSLDRSPADERLRPVPAARLREIAGVAGHKAEVFSR